MNRFTSLNLTFLITLLLVISMIPGVVHAQTSAAEHFMVPVNSLAQLPESAKVIHQYGNQALIEVSGSELSEVVRLRSSALESNQQLSYRSWWGSLAGHEANLLPEGGAATYHLLGLVGPLDSSWTAGLESFGLTVVDHASPFGLLVYGTTSQIHKATDALHTSEGQAVIQYALGLPERSRVSSDLRSWLAGNQTASELGAVTSDAGLVVNVEFHSNISIEQAQRAALQYLVTGPDHVGTLQADQFSGSAAQVAALLEEVQGVAWVEPVYPKVKYNNISVQPGITNIQTVWERPDLAYNGSGIIAGVNDSGVMTNHADFPSGTILATLGAMSNTDNAHGTHVTGTVVGRGAYASPTNTSSCGDQRTGLSSPRGAAWGARTVHNNIFDGGSGNVTSMMNWQAGQGAIINNNSWGYQNNTSYSTESRAADLAVRNHDMSIVFAAGNEASQGISTPGNAKNVITVGASQNDRCGTYVPSNCSGPNINGMACFSSHGPSQGRNKPDISAPGTDILSTESSDSQAYNPWDTGWTGNRYAIMPGTSMAAPLVTGAGAVFYEYYNDRFGTLPSPALVKAALVNSATTLVSSYPSYIPGWGRLDLLTAIEGPTNGSIQYFDQHQVSHLSTGGTWSTTVDVATSSVPLRITLNWTDPAGSSGCSSCLVNDLDLIVTAPNGSVVYRGNQFTGVWSRTNPTGRDNVNNLENVYIQAPQAGTWTIEVSAVSVSQNPSGLSGQDFALVMSGDLGTASGTTWEVTSSVGTGALTGSITPEGVQTVNESATAFFTLTPASGYEISGVTGTCGGTLSGNQFQTSPIVEDCTVTANFLANPAIDVAPAGMSATVAQGSSNTQTLTIENTGGADLVWNAFSSYPAHLDQGHVPGGADVVRNGPSIPAEALDRLTAASGGDSMQTPTGWSQITAIDCDSAPGLVIHDGGVIDNGYALTGYSGVSFVEYYEPANYPSELKEVCFALISNNPSARTLALEVVVFAADGAGGSPGTELGAVSATASNIPVISGVPVAPQWYTVDLSSLQLNLAADGFFIGLRYDAVAGIFIGADQSSTTTRDGWLTAAGFGWSRINDGGLFEDYRALMIRPQLLELTGCYSPTSVPWLTLNPTSGTTAGGGSSAISVTVDTSGLAVGQHDALICITSNDPLQPLVEVPYTLTVTAGGPDPAVLSGRVDTLGYCSDDPGALAGAVIEVTGQSGSWTTTTAADGSYSISLDATQGPVTVDASHPYHLSDSQSGIALSAGQTSAVNFQLILEAPCATVAPDELNFLVNIGDTGTQTLTIGNVDGAADLDWAIDESLFVDALAHFPSQLRYVTHNSSAGTTALADVAAYQDSAWSFDSQLFADLDVLAYSTTGWTAPGYISLDISAPGSLNVISSGQPNAGYAGAFIHKDFSRHYLLLSPDSTSHAAHTFGYVDTTTGQFTDLGVLSGDLSSGTWTSMSWDYATQTLYAVGQSTAGFDLFIIDPDTLHSTQVGPITGSTINPDAMIITIAISPDGLMYGLDIADDVLIAIDKNTAAAEVIGQVGYDANYAQDMDFDYVSGQLYWAGYFGSGNSQLMTIDLDTGLATPVGNIQNGAELSSFTIAIPDNAEACDLISSVDWLQYSPLFGTAVAGGSSAVSVSVNSAGLTPGQYQATLCIDTDDAMRPVLSVPVSLQVQDMPLGTLAGTVQSLGYCSSNTTALAGATISVTGQSNNYTATTDASGSYSLSIEVDDSPVSVSVSHPDHIGDSQSGVIISDGQTTTVNFSLELDAGCIDVSPASLSATVVEGNSDTQSLTLSNNGASSLTWQIATDASSCAAPGGVSWLAVSPTSGTTASSASSNLSVTADSDGLSVGTHTALICISSDDPSNALISVPYTLVVEAPPAGTLAGTVQSLGYCSSNTTALSGATISVTGQSNSYTATTDASGSYSLSIEVDDSPVSVSVSHPDHLGDSQSGVVISEGQTTTVDFQLELDAGCIDVSPASLSATVVEGNSDTQSLTLSNNGASSLTWQIATDASSCAAPAGVSWLAVSPDDGMTASSASSTLSVTADSDGLAVGTHTALICISSDDPSNALISVPYTLVVEAPPAGTLAGTVQSLGYCSSNTTALSGATISVTGQSNSYTATTDASGSYSLSIEVDDSPVTVNVSHPDHLGDSQSGVVISEGQTTTVDFQLELDAGCIDVDPASLSATVVEGNSDTQPLTLSNNGASSLSWQIATDASSCAAPAGVSWLAVSPDNGTTVSAGSTSIAVTADSDGLSVGTHTALICISSDDPDNALVSVPFTLEVTAAEGSLAGTVRSLGYCSDNPAALEGALIEVTGQQGSFSTTSNAAGEYAFELELDESPVDISVSHPDHLGDSQTGVIISEGQTTTVDFDLMLDAGCAIPTPGSLYQLMVEGQTRTQTLTLDNNGGGSLEWAAIVEGSDCSAQQDTVPWLTIDPQLGEIDPQDVAQIDVTADAADLQPGSYSALICVDTDDVENDRIVIPYQLEVLEDALFEDRFEEQP